MLYIGTHLSVVHGRNIQKTVLYMQVLVVSQKILNYYFFSFLFFCCCFFPQAISRCNSFRLISLQGLLKQLLLDAIQHSTFPFKGWVCSCLFERNRVFSRDVMAAILVSLNKGTVAMLVSPTNPLGTFFLCKLFL